MAATPKTERLTLDEVEALARRVLEANGCSSANAAAIAASMAATERDGGVSHGLFRLPGHVAMLRAGAVNGRAEPTAERTAPGVVRVAGDKGFAAPAHVVGLPLLAEAAREAGIAALALTRVVHFGALWPEVEALTERGLVAIAVTGSPPYVAPAGGRRPVFGTNPMAFGWPRPGRSPMVWDQASAATARGEIQVAARDGHSLPEGAGIDAAGQPTRDPQAILDGGAQLPFGGYKGASIAMMVDLLAGPLIGETTSLAGGVSPTGGGPVLGGELVLALDPDRLGGGATSGAGGHAEALFAELLSQEGTRLPGARRHANRARALTEGVDVNAALIEEILTLGG